MMGAGAGTGGGWREKRRVGEYRLETFSYTSSTHIEVQCIPRHSLIQSAQIVRHTDTQTHRHTDTQTDAHTNTHTNTSIMLKHSLVLGCPRSYAFSLCNILLLGLGYDFRHRTLLLCRVYTCCVLSVDARRVG